MSLAVPLWGVAEVNLVDGVGCGFGAHDRLRGGGGSAVWPAGVVGVRGLY